MFDAMPPGRLHSAAKSGGHTIFQVAQRDSVDCAVEKQRHVEVDVPPLAGVMDDLGDADEPSHTEHQLVGAPT
jgi:hypothetical protein